jgi:iron complex transport system substrate-binding protein
MRRRDVLAGLLALGAAPAPAAEERLVVVGASLVEIAYALGAGAAVVGVDRTASHPPEVASVANVGYFRRLAPEGVLALAPTLVLASADAGPERAFAVLEAAGVPVRRAPDVDTPGAVPEKIAFAGRALGREAAARRLATDYAARLAAVREAVGRGSGRRVLFVLAMQSGAPLVGGAGTVPDAMLRAAGLANAARPIEGYKPMNAEALVAARPEGLLMMPEHAERAGGLAAVLDAPGLRLSPAAREGRVATMDGALLMRLGPRTPEAIATLAATFSP